MASSAATPGVPLRRQLQPFAMRLRLADTLQIASRTLWIAAAIALLAQVVGRIFPFEYLSVFTIAPFILWVLFALGYLVFRPLPPMRVARRLDTALALNERLATALELDGNDQQPILALQQADARQRAAELQPNMLPLRIDRQRILAAFLMLVAVVALLLLPNPQDAVLAERAAVRQQIQETIAEIEQLEAQVAESPNLSPADREALQRQLRELREQLERNPGDREQALADISTAETQLRDELQQGADAQRAALEQLSRRLDSMAGDSERQPDATRAADSLENLSEQVAQLPAEEQQQLADELARQAGQMQQSNPQLAQSLNEAADALQRGDTAAAEQALNQAAEQARQSAEQLAQQESIQRSISELQQQRQDIAQAGQQQIGRASCRERV